MLVLLVAAWFQGALTAETDGYDALRDGRYEEALAYFDDALSEPHLQSATAHFGKARAHEELGQVESAVAAYRSALDLSPYHRAARFRLGTLLLRSGRSDEAGAYLRAYEPFRLWDHQVGLLRGMLAEGALTEEDALDKTVALVRLLLDGNALDEAARVLADQSDPRFDVPRARLLVLTSRFDEASEVLERVDTARDPEALWLVGQIAMRQRRLEDALDAFDRLETMWPDPPARVSHQIGTAYGIGGRLDDAVRHLERAVTAEPRLASAHADLGLALVSTGDGARAEEHYRRALELHPDLVAAQQGLGSLLLERGELEDAVALMERSIALRPADPVLRRNLAAALQRAGRTADAEAELRKALELEKR